MCFDCKLRAAADRAARPLYWLLLAASVLLLGFVLALMLCGIAAAAPAPLPRREAAPAPFVTHPKGMCGRWTMWWCNIPYHYELLPDGTFRHDLRLTPLRTEYSGTWKMVGRNELHLTESLKHDAASHYTYELVCTDGYCWRHKKNRTDTWMERFFNLHPLGAAP
jgi:hypothetical protein